MEIKSKANKLFVIFLPLLILMLAGCNTAPAQSRPTAPGLIEANGQATFKNYCSSCHATSGDTVVVGPSMAGIANRAASRIDGMEAREYLRARIEDPEVYTVEGYPENIMPKNFGQIIPDEEIVALVAYLMTLDE